MARNRHVLSLRENPTCILCPETPPCACDPDEVCIVSSRTCNTCGSIQCLPQAAPAASSPSPGVSAGAVAGAVVASVLAFALALALFLWYRRRWQRQAYPTHIGDEKREVPARAEDVLGRPDPNAHAAAQGSPDMPTFRVFPDGSSSLSPSPNTQSSSYAATNGHGGRTPRSQYPAFSGAYSDHRLSAGTHPNLISATFAPGAPSLAGMDAAWQDTPHERPPVPPLPSNSAQPCEDWPAERSYLNIRDSYNTDASFSTDLSSIPIVEPSHGTVKHVMGIARAEVVRTPKPSMSSVHPSVHLNRLSGTKSTIGLAASEKPPPLPTSPLAKTGFTVGEREDRRDRDDPFRDGRTPSPVPPQAPPPPPPANRRSVAPSNATFGDTGSQRWPPLRTSRLPWARKHDSSGSAGTSHDTATASTPSTRSSFGLRWSKGSSAALAPPRPTDVPYTPASYSESPRSVAFPASAPPPPPPPRDALTVPGMLDVPSSRTSIASATSSLAESLLSSFPFVPPSPAGSMHSVHTPPRPPRTPPAVPEIRGGEERRESSATGASVLSSTLGADSRAHTPSAPPSSRTASTPTPPPSSSGTRRSSLTDSPKPLFLNRKVDRSRLSIDREAGASS